MMNSNKYYAVNSLAEYLEICSFKSEYVTGTPNTNQFSYNPTTQAIELNSDGTASKFFLINTNDLKIGDIIEVEVEISNLSGGDNGKIIVVDNNSATNYYQLLSPNTSNRFYKLSYKHLVQQNTNFRIGVGLSGGVSGYIGIRNFKVNVKSKLQNRDSRKLVIEGNNALATKFSVRSDFQCDGATIVQGEEGLTVTWDVPFNSRLRPIPCVALDNSGNSPLYIPRIGGVTKTGFTLKFYNSTGTLVNMSSLNLTSSVFIYITCEV